MVTPKEALANVLERITTEVRPKLDIRPCAWIEGDDDGEDEAELDPTRKVDGYDCCGCPTYDRIVADIESIIREEMGS